MGKTIYKRATHEKNFTIVDNDFINDRRLSLTDKGLLLEILSNSDEWTIYEIELVKRSADGRAKVRSAKQHLIDLGYLELKAERKNGQFDPTYTVYEKPRKLSKREYIEEGIYVL